MMGDGKWPLATALLLLGAVGLAAADVAPKTAPAPAPLAAIQPPQLLYLGEKRPLRFRLDVRIRSKSFDRAWEEFIGRLFDYADVNGDKVITPDEAQRLPQPSCSRVWCSSNSAASLWRSPSHPSPRWTATRMARSHWTS